MAWSFRITSGDDYLRMAALGVTSYGQMTTGSYMYIGPRGIVHGTVDPLERRPSAAQSVR